MVQALLSGKRPKHNSLHVSWYSAKHNKNMSPQVWTDLKKVSSNGMKNKIWYPWININTLSLRLECIKLMFLSN